MPLKLRQDLSGKGIAVFGSVQTLDIGQHELLFFCPYWKNTSALITLNHQLLSHQDLLGGNSSSALL